MYVHIVYVYTFEENKHEVFIVPPINLAAIEYQIIEYHFIFPFILFQIMYMSLKGM